MEVCFRNGLVAPFASALHATGSPVEFHVRTCCILNFGAGLVAVPAEKVAIAG